MSEPSVAAQESVIRNEDRESVIGGLSTGCLGCSPLNAIVMRQTIASIESKAVRTLIKNVSTGCVPLLQIQVSVNSAVLHCTAIDVSAGEPHLSPDSALLRPNPCIAKEQTYSQKESVKCICDGSLAVIRPTDETIPRISQIIHSTLNSMQTQSNSIIEL